MSILIYVQTIKKAHFDRLIAKHCFFWKFQHTFTINYNIFLINILYLLYYKVSKINFKAFGVYLIGLFMQMKLISSEKIKGREPTLDF